MNEWISLKDKKPPLGKKIEICYERKDYFSDKTFQIVTIGFYEDGTRLESDTLVNIDENEMDCSNLKFNEDFGEYYVPEGWYESLTSMNSEYYCVLDKNTEIVTHWRYIDLPKGENDKINN